MILFCEECGTRHDIDDAQLSGDVFKFLCTVCRETLIVSLANKKQSKTVQASLGQPAVKPVPSGNEDVLKILVVDDSKLIRRVLRDIIESDGRKKVIGEAENGKAALDFLVSQQPDVITLDINMPVMDGLTTLKHIMISRPIPTVMISALTKEGSLETFDSLKYGAIDFLPKPTQVKGADLNSQKEEILRKIEQAAGIQIESIRYLRRPSTDKDPAKSDSIACVCVVAMGVAEGGYGALLNVVPRLKEDLPAAYIAVMHQAPHHIDGFARYLDQCSRLSVCRATDGMVLKGGRCYLAAASEHISIAQDGEQTILKVNSSPFPTPMGAIDMLMDSVSQTMKDRAAGVILTGTGDDGVAGMGKIKQMGGTLFVQDPRSCLFKETPLKAAEKHPVDYLVSDKQMAGAINAFIKEHRK